ncbi:MAG: hypothetical protein H6581_19395 [Bacteroidia bacterium]|nr:hypothetical protein [Bacteroidia bacterium]
MPRSIVNLLLILVILLPAVALAQSRTLEELHGLVTYTSLDEALKNPREVKKFSLELKKGQKIPPDLFKLQALEWLEIKGEGFTSLPKEAGMLVRLQGFSLQACPQAMLGATFSQLKGMQYLRFLELKNTPHGPALPDNLGTLTNLEVLNLSGYHLDSLPPSVGELQKLQILDLRSTGLDTLPASFGTLSSLQELHLGNSFQRLPREICQLRNLRFLDLSYSQISNLPQELSQLEELGSLNLNFTKFNLPANLKILQQLQPLTHLSLAGLKLVELPPAFAQLNLVELDLSQNGFSSLPAALPGMASLKKLNLKGNRFLPENQEVIEGELPRVKVLF